MTKYSPLKENERAKIFLPHFVWGDNLLAFFCRPFTLVRAKEKFPVKKLHCNDSKNELEQDVNNEDVEDVLQRVDDTVEHSLQFGHTFDSFQRP